VETSQKEGDEMKVVSRRFAAARPELKERFARSATNQLLQRPSGPTDFSLSCIYFFNLFMLYS
jgi:hypothetical protein